MNILLTVYFTNNSVFPYVQLEKLHELSFDSFVSLQKYIDTYPLPPNGGIQFVVHCRYIKTKEEK